MFRLRFQCCATLSCISHPHPPSLPVGLEDYLDVIKTPMDLTSIENKLENSEYAQPKGILDDMRCECSATSPSKNAAVDDLAPSHC